MLYKALHNFSVGGTLFEADKLYSEKDVLAIGNPDIDSDFVAVPEDEAQEKGVGVSKPVPDPSVKEVLDEQKATADRAAAEAKQKAADEKAKVEQEAKDKAAAEAEAKAKSEAGTTGVNTTENQNQNGGSDATK